MDTSKKLVILCFVAISVVTAQPAFAGPIVYFNEFREVNAFGTGASSSAEGRFQELYAVSDPRFGGGATAFQDSWIEASFVGGFGEAAGADAQGRVIGAISTLLAAFVLDEYYQAHLAVGLLAAGSGNAFVTFTNLDTSDGLLQRSVLNDEELALFGGILSPGRYQILLGADASRAGGEGPFSAAASFDGGLSLTPLGAAPVPEPASMTLLGIGLAAAGAKRWRRRRL